MVRVKTGFFIYEIRGVSSYRGRGVLHFFY